MLVGFVSFVIFQNCGWKQDRMLRHSCNQETSMTICRDVSSLENVKVVDDIVQSNMEGKLMQMFSLVTPTLSILIVCSWA